MKLTRISTIFLVLALFFTGCAMDKNLHRGMIVPRGDIRAGVTAPDILYLDETGTLHRLNRTFDEKYTLVVFTGEKTCATQDSALIKTGKALYRNDAPANLVEIVGGDKGCQAAQKACVLKRAIPDTHLITLCDESGETRRKYAANEARALYLIDTGGTIIKTAPFSQLGSVLKETAMLAQKLDSEQATVYED